MRDGTSPPTSVAAAGLPRKGEQTHGPPVLLRLHGVAKQRREVAVKLGLNLRHQIEPPEGLLAPARLSPRVHDSLFANARVRST